MLRTNNDEVITDENILIKFNVQNFCIKSHDVKFQIISVSVIENFNQLKVQNFNVKQLKS